MADFLSSLGITGATPPPASAYSDQQAETKNLASAKSQLTGITSNIGLAMTTAKQLGLDPTYTQSLENLNSEATSIASANLTSAQLAAKTSALNDKLATAKATQEAAVKQQAITAMTAATTTIAARLAAVRADTTAPAANVKQYEDLNKSAQAALEALKAPPRTDLSGAAAIIYPTPDALLYNLSDLDTALDAAQNKVFNWPRFRKKILRIFMYCIAGITIIFGFVLGGVILSNTYAADHFWGIKLFYFIYGAAFFPLSVIYGTIKPPYWVSGLIPLFSLEPRIVPTQPPPPPAPKPVKAALPTTVAGIKGAVGSKLKGMMGGIKIPGLSGGGQEGGADELSDPAIPAVQSISLMTKLFGYKLVDPATPTAEEISSKTYLRVMAGVESALIVTCALYYGIDTLILKNTL